MPIQFPSPEWLAAFHAKLNSDTQYAQIARNWEGDLVFTIESDSGFGETVHLYFDLWHGTSRAARVLASPDEVDALFSISAPFSNWRRILDGELHPMQALLTQKLRVRGNMAYLMRHVPTVLDFTRCAQELTQGS
jgi:putative sterol carrier protein